MIEFSTPLLKGCLPRVAARRLRGAPGLTTHPQ